MNCSDHPDIVVNSHCDVCHKPFCPSCLQNDRGRSVCKRCFDPALQAVEMKRLAKQPLGRMASLAANTALWLSVSMVASMLLYLSVSFVRFIQTPC